MIYAGDIDKEIDKRQETLQDAEVEGANLLDIGVGCLSHIAAERFNCKVTNIDISYDRIRYEKQQNPNINLLCADALYLPFKDKIFDVSVSYGVLHHIHSDIRERLIYEMLRVSKTKIIITEYNEKGFKILHSKDNYTPVDLAWLENKLSHFKNIKIFRYELLNVYVCKI